MNASGRGEQATALQSPESISISLLNRVKAHDQGAWQRLVDLYGPVVYQWCRGWGVSGSDAPDVLQEVFRAVAASVARFERERRDGTFRGWLWTVARNETRDYFARRGNRPNAVGGSEFQAKLLAVPGQSREEAGEAEGAAEGNGLAHRAVAMIRGDFEQRTWQAFWRTAVEGQTASDVARELGMTSRAVRQAKHRVLQRLREEFSGLID